MKMRTLLAALFFTVGAAVLAQTPPAVAPVGGNDPAATPGLDQRQARQDRRINQGLASGQLTPKEARRLKARERRLQAAKLAAKSDGVVTKRERRRLQHLADRNSRAIKRQKHDAQKTAPAN